MDDVCRVAVKAVWGFNCPWGSFDAKWPFSMQRAFFDQNRKPSAKGVISFEVFVRHGMFRSNYSVKFVKRAHSLHLPTIW